MSLEKKTLLAEMEPSAATGERILLAEMNPAVVSGEIEDFIVEQVVRRGFAGGVIGLSGGVDSTTTAALAKQAFDRYNIQNPAQTSELIAYILPSKTNDPQDKEDGIKAAERLGIKYEVLAIDFIADAYFDTNPEAIVNNYHRGNLMSRIRANILNTKAATENKLLIGTGNRDEDFGIGYYTLFGDGAVHISPIGNLPKRLVRQMARYLGFRDIADRVPAAGLEPGQTDFRDLGYSYDVVEIVTEGLKQGFQPCRLIQHRQVVPVVERDIKEYQSLFGVKRFSKVEDVVYDVLRRHRIAKAKAEIIHPPMVAITLRYAA